MVRGGRGKNRGATDAAGEKITETKDGYAVSYQSRMVKCNKEACKKCASGDGHGPYWYKVYRTPEGKIRKEYVGKNPPAGAGE